MYRLSCICYQKINNLVVTFLDVTGRLFVALETIKLMVWGKFKLRC